MPVTDKEKNLAVSPEMFSGLMSFLGIDWSGEKNLAVAVSGGGDSMALALLLSDWARQRGMKLHALTVDHGLRPESAEEAKFVSRTLKPLGVIHKTLVWEGKKPKTGIQEAAREARYKLMADYCIAKKIRYLCVAHHGQDQIETILFRMAKGTGVDGLVGMRPVQDTGYGLTLLRPLLSISHNELLTTCKASKIDWVEDPSNENKRYARVRIRNILDVLQAEGLSPKRIDGLSKRLGMTIELIDYLIEDKYKLMIINKDTERIEIMMDEFLSLPQEGKTRILRQMITDLYPDKKYPARLEDIERLASRFTENFRGATLGGCIFRKKKGSLFIQKEGV